MKEIRKPYYEYYYKIRQNKDDEDGLYDTSESITWHMHFFKRKRNTYKILMLGINFYAIHLKTKL